MALALSDMSILDELTDVRLGERAPLLSGAALAVADACLSEGALASLLDLCPRVFVDPVSIGKCCRMERLIGRFHCVKMNRLEASCLSGVEIDSNGGLEEAARRILARGVRKVYITLGAEGAWVEHKPTAAVLHVRLASPDDAARASLDAVTASGALGLSAMRGKDVVETGVVATSKGQAIDALRAETGARAVFYMGDDVTDERAFAVLHDGDVSVRVGPGETVARHRVAGPDDAAHVLARLANLLTGPVHVS